MLKMETQTSEKEIERFKKSQIELEESKEKLMQSFEKQQQSQQTEVEILRKVRKC